MRLKSLLVAVVAVLALSAAVPSVAAADCKSDVLMEIANAESHAPSPITEAWAIMWLQHIGGYVFHQCSWGEWWSFEVAWELWWFNGGGPPLAEWDWVKSYWNNYNPS